jgi:hypothetical protein
MLVSWNVYCNCLKEFKVKNNLDFQTSQKQYKKDFKTAKMFFAKKNTTEKKYGGNRFILSL